MRERESLWKKGKLDCANKCAAVGGPFLPSGRTRADHEREREKPQNKSYILNLHHIRVVPLTNDVGVDLMLQL